MTVESATAFRQPGGGSAGVLTGKRALITGGTSGIGRAIVERLVADGADVTAHYNSSEAAARELAASSGVTLARADLAASSGPRALADQIDGPLDILIHNASLVLATPFADETVDAFDRQFAVNVRAPFFLTQALLPRMGAGGRIVFITSVVARRAFGNGAIVGYPATKAAQEAMMLHLAQQQGARGLTVNAVAPGVVDTGRHDWLPAGPAGDSAVAAFQALPRVGQPKDVADVVAFLVSNDARWMTGQVLQAGGGTRL